MIPLGPEKKRTNRKKTSPNFKLLLSNPDVLPKVVQPAASTAEVALYDSVSIKGPNDQVYNIPSKNIAFQWLGEGNDSKKINDSSILEGIYVIQATPELLQDFDQSDYGTDENGGVAILGELHYAVNSVEGYVPGRLGSATVKHAGMLILKNQDNILDLEQELVERSSTGNLAVWTAVDPQA